MNTAERIRRHLAGETNAEEYIEIPRGDTIARVPVLGEINANEHSFYEPGYRPTKLLSFGSICGEPTAVCEFEELHPFSYGPGWTVSNNVYLRSNGHLCNGPDEACWTLLSDGDRARLREFVSTLRPIPSKAIVRRDLLQAVEGFGELDDDSKAMVECVAQYLVGPDGDEIARAISKVIAMSQAGGYKNCQQLKEAVWNALMYEDQPNRDGGAQ